MCWVPLCGVLTACCALWQGGVPKKHQDALRRELLHTYGHEYLITLDLLQSAGAPLPALVSMLDRPGRRS